VLDLEQTELIDKVAERFRALSDANRLKLLLILKEGPQNVGTLTERLGVSQAGVSKHLAVLKGAGLVTCERVGTQAIYSVADERIYDMCGVICDGLFREIRSQQNWLGASQNRSSSRR
jgi:DNA-binding transcriptional ArsR family regulator